MKSKTTASSADIQFIRDNPEMRARDISKKLGLHTTIIKYWQRMNKPKKLINKPKRIKQVSKKMKDRLEKYKIAKATYNVANCEICGNTENLSIHHIAGRSGSLLYDHKNFLQVCMAGSTHLNEEYPESNQTEGCHPWIERNLKLARELGYSKSKIKQQ